MSTTQKYSIFDIEDFVHHVSVKKKENGRNCLDQVCQNLGILEKEYFGLKYVGKHGERLWLNLRNPMQEQLPQGTTDLELRVKFFVKPKKILQPLTRKYFYSQLKELILTKRWHIAGGNMHKVAALILQVEYGDYQRELEDNYKRFLGDLCDTEHSSTSDILSFYRELSGISSELGIERFLEESYKIEGYGAGLHQACSRKGVAMVISVGPQAIIITNQADRSKTRYAYCQISFTAYQGKKFQIVFSNSRTGTQSQLLFTLQTKAFALALYRAVTEFHTFFCRETVGLGVRNARYRTSFFTSLRGSRADRYYFDVLKTHKEVFEELWPELHRSPIEEHRILINTPSLPMDLQSLSQPTSGVAEEYVTPMSASCYRFPSPPVEPPPDYTEIALERYEHISGSPDQQLVNPVAILTKAHQLEEELIKIKKVMTCRICEENPIGATFCPCGHTLCCSSCAARYQRCFECSTKVTSVQRILLS